MNLLDRFDKIYFKKDKEVKTDDKCQKQELVWW